MHSRAFKAALLPALSIASLLLSTLGFSQQLTEGEWIGDVLYLTSGMRGNESFVLVQPETESPHAIFLSDPIRNVSLDNKSLSFEWGETNASLDCQLDWDDDNNFFTGQCQSSTDEPYANMTLRPPIEETDSTEDSVDEEQQETEPDDQT